MVIECSLTLGFGLGLECGSISVVYFYLACWKWCDGLLSYAVDRDCLGVCVLLA